MHNYHIPEDFPERLEATDVDAGRADGAGVAVWAIADLAFLLLIAFLVGATAEGRHPYVLQDDNTALRGPETPPVRKEIAVRIFFRPGRNSEETFRVQVETIPSLGNRSGFVVESRERLIERLQLLEEDSRSTQEENPDHRIRYYFLSPSTLEYGTVLRTYVALQEALEENLYVGLYQPETNTQIE